MPNTDNILAPLTMVGNGRSGTSLVSRVLADHPRVQFAGETANLIHSVWKALESSLIPKKRPEIPDVIRHHFLRLFPGTNSCWMHKPIGVPIVWSMFEDEDEFLDWYWEVLPAVFPRARFFTVLRHPLDVVVSSHKWWGWSMESIINSNRIMARLLAHPKSRVDFAVNYHELIKKPKKHVKQLLDHLELEFDKVCLNAFDSGHVVSKSDMKDRRTSSFSHSDKWKTIEPKLITAEYREAVDACWKKYGHDFGGWPD